jgi:hypothetical protein
MTDTMTEAQTIQDELDACASIAEVEAVADKYRERVQAMHREGGDAKTLAIHIVHLKHWLINIGPLSAASQLN